MFERPTEYAEFDTGRKMYVTPEILAITTPPFAETKRDERLAEFANMLDAFSELGRFSISENPDDKERDTMLARVHPVEAEFWSLRVTDPEDTPGIRAIGAFVDQDEFLALHWDWRECMMFQEDVQIAMEAWQDYFGLVTPHSSRSLSGYLSNFWRV